MPNFVSKLFKVTFINYILGITGIIVSLYLTYSKLTYNPLFCGIGDCSTVQASEYSYFLGIPVAILGLFYYLAFFGFTLVPNKIFLKLWVIWGIVFSTYLTYLEIYVIEAICMWCVISFIVVLLMGVNNLFRKV